MSEKRYISIVAACVGAAGIILCLVLVLGGKGGSGGRKQTSANNTTVEAQSTTVSDKRYNKEDIVIVTDIDTANSKITVRKLEESAEFVLSYNRGTVVKNKYDNQLMMEQITVGEIARLG